MEVDSVKEMFSRSEENFGVKYSNYIGDGDSATFKAILDLKPYGDELTVVKSECIFSTKEEPNHECCPTGPESWCKWQKAVALNRDSTLEDLTPLLGQEMKEHLLPIYENLSREDLLERCLGDHTQNANESFNSTIWRLTPKHLHSGQKIIELSACIAAGVFNEGYNSILRLMNQLDIVVGNQALNFAKNTDEARVTRQNRMSQSETKAARKYCQETATTGS